MGEPVALYAEKVAGVDEVTKEVYNERLEENVEELVARMKRQSYKPQPARRVYIPKPGTDKKRPLGIPSYEDKLVQSATAKVLNRSNIKYVVDADIRGFFDNVNHEWMMKFIAHRIDDTNMNRLISRMLKEC